MVPDWSPTRGAGTRMVEAKSVRASVKGQMLGGLFPRKPGTASCRLGVGGPAPGRSIPGTCETRVHFKKDSTVVECVDRWSGRDSRFNQEGTGELTHTWQFQVSPRGAVRFLRAHGDNDPLSVG
jgi:hypothetical protein